MLNYIERDTHHAPWLTVTGGGGRVSSRIIQFEWGAILIVQLLITVAL